MTPGDITSHLAGCCACRRTVNDIRLNNSLLTEITRVRRASRLRRERLCIPPNVDDYEILECVAQGGQGIVYRAIQNRTKRSVALKLLHGGHFATPRQRSRFDREVELAAGLHHPNIVTVHDRGISSDGRPFLSMAFIEGRPLDQWAASCRTCGAEPAREAPIYHRLVAVIIKVCSALSHAHQRGVLHRDLKPSNILVDANDDPHIVDFGLAKLENSEASVNATLTGEFMGTIAYAAPEQVSIADSHADARSDVYSLGVLLYEVLTGQLPYSVTGAIADVIHRIMTAEPPPPSRIDSSIPADLEIVALKAMTKDLDRRYQSARELGEDLRRVLANEPIVARSDSTWYLIRKTAHRHRRTLFVAAASAGAIVMSIAAVTAYVVFNAQANAARARAAAETERAEATSLVLRSASHSRSRKKDASDYAVRDLQRLNTQLRFGWFANNRERESAAAFLVSSILRKDGSSWGAEDLIRQANLQRAREANTPPEDTSHGLRDLAEVLLTRHRIPEAVQYAEWALAVDKEAGGETGLDAARDLELLARIHLARGNNASALKLAAEAADIQTEKLGAESEDLARSLDTHSAALLAMGDFAAAEGDCLRSLRLRLSLLQDEDPAVAESLRRLAAIRDGLPRILQNDALAQALDATSAPQVADHLRRLASDLDRLASSESRDPEWPLATLRLVLSVKEAILGPDHRGLLSTLSALAVELHARRDYSEELLILERVASVIKHVHGARSLPYASCLEDRAELFRTLGLYPEAIVVLQQSLEILWALPVLQRDEFNAAVNERTLALLMTYVGDFEGAARHFSHLGDVVDRMHGAENPLVPYARAGRAWALVRLGRTEGAEREASEALALANRLGKGMAGGQRCFVTYCAGSILTDLGKFEEGGALLTTTWEGDRYNDPLRDQPMTDPLRQYLIRDLIKNCAARGDVDAEVRWRRELLNTQPQSVSIVND